MSWAGLIFQCMCRRQNLRIEMKAVIEVQSTMPVGKKVGSVSKNPFGLIKGVRYCMRSGEPMSS